MSAGSFFLIFFLGVFFASAACSELCISPGPQAVESFIISRIDSAHARVWVAMYRLTSAPCVRALVRAKERGLDVRVVLDRGLLCVPAYAATRRHFFRGEITPWWGGGSPLMHHKWAVIDNSVVTGSVNWTYAGLNKNHEICFACDDPTVVQRYVTHFVVLTRRSSRLDAASPPSNGLVFFIPDHQKALRSALSNAFDAATSKICLSMYAFTSGWCWEKVTAAARRGVSVQVILEPDQIRTPALVARAKQAGVRIKKYTSASGAILHDKCVLIDDMVWLGSMNLTGVGLRYNDENMVMVKDAAVVRKITESFNVLFNVL